MVKHCWKNTTILVLFALIIKLALKGFYRERLLLPNKSPVDVDPPKDRKVILMLCDALREDFVEFDDRAHTRLDPDADTAF
jgi:hypothetical protein